MIMNLQEKVIKLVAEAIKADPTSLGLDTSFIDDLNLDSLDMVEMMMKLEDEFGIEIPEEDAEKLKTIKDVIDLLIKKNPQE